MSSNLEDQQAQRVRYYGVQRGVVTNIADPMGLHRVKAIIPGIIEPESDWLYPLTAGGGSPQRGGHVVPAVGSDVAVWFHNGDPNGNSVYMGSNWGTPSAGTEVPGDAKDAGGSNPELVQTLELGGAAPGALPTGQTSSDYKGSLRFTVDERPGKRAFQLLDVDENGVVQCAIVLDREQRAIVIKAVSQILIQCTGSIVIDGLETNINGRRVAPAPAQIG